MNRKKILPVALMFTIGLTLGSGLTLANHIWRCRGKTAYHWSSPTVRYANAVEETNNNSVVRNTQNYTSAFGGSVGVWNTTIIDLVAGTDLRLYYDSYGTNGWLGLATIYINGCQIYRATSKLNDSYLRNTSKYSQLNVDHVACQEVGHTFGLDHNHNATDTCMNDWILTAGNKINQHDRDQLDAIY